MVRGRIESRENGTFLIDTVKNNLKLRSAVHGCDNLYDAARGDVIVYSRLSFSVQWVLL